MIREADIDGDGQINYDGAHPIPLPSSTSPKHRFHDLRCRVRQGAYDSRFLCDYLFTEHVIDADDAGKVIALCHLMRSRIDVSDLLSITCIYEPELTSASKVVKIPVYLDHVGDPALFLVLVSIHVFF